MASISAWTAAIRRRGAPAAYWVLGWALPEPSGDEIRTHTDLRRLQQGGVDAQFFSIWPHSDYAKTPGASFERANAMIDALLEQLRRHPERLELALGADDIHRIAASGRIAALMGLEGGHAIENDLAHLRAFHARGVRYTTLTWSNTNDWADALRRRAAPRRPHRLRARGGARDEPHRHVGGRLARLGRDLLRRARGLDEAR